MNQTSVRERIWQALTLYATGANLLWLRPLLPASLVLPERERERAEPGTPVATEVRE